MDLTTGHTLSIVPPPNLFEDLEMSYVITRQRSYPDGILYVELETGGPDMTSPGAIAGMSYAGEGEYDDPREASRKLIAVRNAWQVYRETKKSHDDQDTILVSIGTTMGGLTTHDPGEMTDEEIIAWGQKEYDRLPKCDQCGDILPSDKRNRWHSTDDPDLGTYCSENCCNLAVEADRKLNQQYVVENQEDFTWWNDVDKEWVENPDDATAYYQDAIHDKAVALNGIPRAIEEARDCYEANKE